jgi:uroporphyrinogen-III synthase
MRAASSAAHVIVSAGSWSSASAAGTSGFRFRPSRADRAREVRARRWHELRRRAAEPVAVPLLEVLPAIDSAALEATLARAADYDWIVYTSANAVRFATPRAEALARARVACIGEATARAARAAGLRVDLVPTGESTPARLASTLAAAGELSGLRVLLPRAERARETLSRALAASGAHVDAVEAYRTRAPEGAGARLSAELVRGLDAVVLTSPSTVAHLFELLAPAEQHALCARAIFACIGSTTADALGALGSRRHAAWPGSDRGALINHLSELEDEWPFLKPARRLRRTALRALAPRLATSGDLSTRLRRRGAACRADRRCRAMRLGRPARRRGQEDPTFGLAGDPVQHPRTSALGTSGYDPTGSRARSAP